MSSSLTGFQWLSKSRNLSSLDLLANLLESPIESVRREAAFNLSDRPEMVAQEILIRKLGTAGTASAAAWKNIAFRLVPGVLDALSDERNELFEAALKTSVACEIVESLPILVATAERFGSPYGLTAGRLLLELSIRCNRRVTETGLLSEIRTKLIQVLQQSVENFPLHRNNVILDAFLACSIPDDAHIHQLLNNPSQNTFKLFARHWKTTQCIEAIDLLVQTLWKHYLSSEVQAILFQNRKDRLLAKSFAKSMRRELTEHAIERLKRYGTPICCLTIQPNDDELPIDDRLNLWRLLAITNGPLDRFVNGIHYFLAEHRKQCEILVADMLKLYSPPSHLEVMTCIGLDDDVFQSVATPGAPSQNSKPVANTSTSSPTDSSAAKSDLQSAPTQVFSASATRQALNYFIENYQSFAEPLKHAIEFFLLDFHCANLLDKLNTKSDDYIRMFSQIVSIAESDWEESLKSCMKSPVPAVRCKAVIAASYFPLSEKLRATIRSLLDDPKEVIREEAEFAMARYNVTESSDSQPDPFEKTFGYVAPLSEKNERSQEVAYGVG